MPHSDQRLHRAQLTRSHPVSHPESSLLNQPLALKKELLNLCMDWGHDHPCKCYCTQTHSNLTEGKERSCSMPLNKQPRQSTGLGSIRESQVCSSPLPLPAIPCCSLSALHLSPFLRERCFWGSCVCFIFPPQSKQKCHHQVTTWTLSVQPPYISNSRLLLHSLKHQGFTAESPRWSFLLLLSGSKTTYFP